MRPPRAVACFVESTSTLVRTILDDWERSSPMLGWSSRALLGAVPSAPNDWEEYRVTITVAADRSDRGLRSPELKFSGWRLNNRFVGITHDWPHGVVVLCAPPAHLPRLSLSYVTVRQIRKLAARVVRTGPGWFFPDDDMHGGVVPSLRADEFLPWESSVGQIELCSRLLVDLQTYTSLRLKLGEIGVGLGSVLHAGMVHEDGREQGIVVLPGGVPQLYELDLRGTRAPVITWREATTADARRFPALETALSISRSRE
jgi:hypothetical protein